MSEDNKNKYLYPVEELDKIIDQLQKGIIPMISDDMQLEVELRYKELTSEDDSDIDSSEREKHAKLVSQRIEEEKRKASRNVGFVIPISDKQKEQIRKEMSVSIVRPNPNSSYNYTDEQGQLSEEYKELTQKLSNLRNCYYNTIDYTNAIGIIKEAIEYSLEHDYPLMSKEEAVRAFNRGEIKFSYCKLPKLFIGYTKEVTDPEILRGIVTGEIKTFKKNDETFKPRRSEDDKPVQMDYEVIAGTEYTSMIEAHNRGVNTPIDPLIDTAKAKSFNRLLFSPTKSDDKPMPLFDWTQDDAARKYKSAQKNMDYYNTDQLIADLNKENNMELNNELTVRIKRFLKSISQTETKPIPEPTVIKTNPEAEMLEYQLLQSIKMNQPNINK